MLENLRNVFGLEYQDVIWQSLFSIICQKLWKQKNLRIFQGIHSDAINIIQAAWWIPPLTGSIKLNVDGACNPSSGLASSAVVARDEHGRWF
ncbi:hypothetical protein Gohar_018190 [Gossypium harknessii]|uniref:RNase H type-1 domain-containing protein n=1 Tax=Gossypium harknessii TaxID=34285 RepID=A0A7J9G892_9ROSI|nr:hypothetical protein [Gossypium harknessii]